MGIFRAKDPHKNLYAASGGRILSRSIDETNMKYLWLVEFSPKPENKNIVLSELKIGNMSPAFKEFTEAFLSQFNKQFPDAATTSVGLDFVSIPEWPNYNISKPERPYQIAQTRNLGLNYESAPVSQKRTSIVIFIDGNSVGKLFALRKKQGETFLEEIVDLGVSVESEIGMALWTISTTSPNVYSSLFIEVHWTAGANHFDKILFGVPRREAALLVGTALAKSGLK
jgi:hypothetical protein